jgi:glycosyltransferase involved in cell wall biosynthesis
MTQNLRVLKDATPLHAVVVIEGALGDSEFVALLAQIAVLKRRFGLAVSGVAPGVNALGAQGLQSLRNCAVFDNLYFSGDSAWLVADGLTAARRTGHGKHLFLSARSLLNDPVPSLRVLVELLGASYDALWVPGLSALYCDQSGLDTLTRPRAAEAWAEWAARAWAELGIRAKSPHELGSQWVFKPTVERALAEPAGQSLELYVSRTGLGRLGGLARMREQAIAFGKRALDEFDLVVAIDNGAQEFALSQEPGSGLALLCGWTLLPGLPQGGQGYWADVVPAPVWADPAEDADIASAKESTPKTPAILSLPRQMLQMRLTRVPQAPKVDSLRLVFVMSNFEKGPLIPAALYGVAMQTHANVTLRFTDDASADDSLAYARQFERLLPQGQDFFKIQINAVNRGTYWIRNEAIYRAHDPETVFLINDSDDVSSLQRGTLQARMLQENPSLSGCFMDIVRIDTEHTPLRLESEVERYGTASLAFRKSLVDKIGYFENIKRNADTEFIERVRILMGNDALQRYRYPCLYQVFDGRNLTADIYTQVPGASEIQADHGARALHTLLFRQRHRYLKAESAASQYRFPESTTPPEYKALGAHFLLPDYGAPDAIAVVMHASDGICRKIAARGALVVQLTTKASPWESGVVRLYDARGVAFSANLGAKCIIEHLLHRVRFTGYLLLVHDATSLDATVRPGALLPQLEQATLQSKSLADGEPIEVSPDATAETAFEWGSVLQEMEKWMNTKMSATVLLHTNTLR